MTYRERLAKEHPDKINERCQGNCYGCPSDYGYETVDFCYAIDVAVTGQSDENCTKCWNREIKESK